MYIYARITNAPHTQTHTHTRAEWKQSRTDATAAATAAKEQGSTVGFRHIETTGFDPASVFLSTH